jgi:hemoglobin-like flavoprotein
MAGRYGEEEKVEEKKTTPSAVAGFTTQEQVLELVLDSWENVSKTGEYSEKPVGTMEAEAAAMARRQEEEKKKAAAAKKKSFFSWGSKTSDHDAKGGYEDSGKASAQKANAAGEKQFDVPDTFPDMVKLNAAMTGANLRYIEIMLDEFDNLVTDICRTGQLQEQTDILAMRISKDVKGQIKTSEFKICMLAAMRSLIPSRWDTAHEKAWSWLWDSIDTQLKLSLPLPARYEMPVTRFVTETMTPEDLGDLGLKVWLRMFVKEPKVENVFKQSNERLKWIAVQAMLYAVKIYQDPSSMNVQMQQLGLKHIMFRVDPAYFALFVTCIDEEMKERCDDENICNGLNWALTVIACILARAVEAGSTPLLMCALNNDVKGLKTELDKQGRGNRARALLGA